MDGKAFKKLRLQLGLSQAKLAKELGCTPTTVARWERSERKIFEPVARLLALLVKLNAKSKGRR